MSHIWAYRTHRDGERRKQTSFFYLLFWLSFQLHTLPSFVFMIVQHNLWKTWWVESQIKPIPIPISYYNSHLYLSSYLKSALDSYLHEPKIPNYIHKHKFTKKGHKVDSANTLGMHWLWNTVLIFIFKITFLPMTDVVLLLFPLLWRGNKEIFNLHSSLYYTFFECSQIYETKNNTNISHCHQWMSSYFPIGRWQSTRRISADTNVLPINRCIPTIHSTQHPE